MEQSFKDHNYTYTLSKYKNAQKSYLNSVPFL